MAKRRKGAKKSSASGSRTRESKVKKRPRPVSPVQRKRAPKKGSAAAKRSSAARRGWETRRRENPLRWGREAIAERRKNSRVVDESVKAIERELREIEQKALKQKDEAERAGGTHPEIAKKLAVFERIETEIAAMKQNIRTFNSPRPDEWALKAYTLLEKFITLRDFGAPHSDTWMIAIGTKIQSHYGEFDTEEAAVESIDRLNLTGARPILIDGVNTAYKNWYAAKQEAKERSPDWPAWMAMIGSVLGLPMHGPFSVDSFVTS
jgi:hypothetical protein